MTAVALTRALVLEAPLRQPDGQGGYSEIWGALGSVWAQVTPRTGRAAAGIELSLSLVSYRITVRAAPQDAPSRPQPGQRFREGNRLFQINAVTEAPAGAHYLDCFADEEIAR